MPALRIGLIDYLNPQPFYFGLRERCGDFAAFTWDVPSRLNAALREGRLDAAIVSARAAIDLSSDVLVIPGHSVSARGRVGSVLLFTWASGLAALDGQRVAVTNHSASGAALLEALFRHRYRVRPTIERADQDLEAMLASAQAALVIGDDALVEAHRRRTFRKPDGTVGQPAIVDLGLEWRELTGLPFTFALWAVRREAAADARRLGFPEALAASKKEGLAHLDELASRLAPKHGVPADVVLRYFRALDYGLDREQLEGLERFIELGVPAASPKCLEFL
jgi:chorismate dehydratase